MRCWAVLVAHLNVWCVLCVSLGNAACVVCVPSAMGIRRGMLLLIMLMVLAKWLRLQQHQTNPSPKNQLGPRADMACPSVKKEETNGVQTHVFDKSAHCC
jgi:hypothetical protein